MHPAITQESEYMLFNKIFMKEMLKQVTDYENTQ